MLSSLRATQQTRNKREETEEEEEEEEKEKEVRVTQCHKFAQCLQRLACLLLQETTDIATRCGVQCVCVYLQGGQKKWAALGIKIVPKGVLSSSTS